MLRHVRPYSKPAAPPGSAAWALTRVDHPRDRPSPVLDAIWDRNKHYMRLPRETSEPSRQAPRRAAHRLTETLSMPERLACRAVGLARSTYRRLPLSETPAGPDAQLLAWLRAYATKHPCHGFRRAWAALRYDECREVNKKKVHRLLREEGL